MSRIRLTLSATATLMATTAIADVPNVAVDIAPVHSLVARVMDGIGAPALVIPVGASPHEYSLRPSEAAALQDADVVFWIGEDLSPRLESAIETLASEAAVTSLLDADGTRLLDFRENAVFEAHAHEEHGDDDAHEHDNHGHDDHGHDHEQAKASHDAHDHGDGHSEAKAGHDDHDHGDNHAHEDDGHDHALGARDPHAWLSIANAQTWLDLIAGQLSAADPDNAGAYFANAAAAKAEMDALSTEVAAMLEPARGMDFVVFHDAYQYFEDSFDFPAAGAISLSDAREPGPARLAEVQGRIRDEGIDCVLAEPQFNPALVDTVLDGVEARSAVIDPLGSDLTPGPELYPQLIRNMATSLTSCLTNDS